MTNHSLKLILTKDGSHSLLREDLNETYHSSHGARGESTYVFIEHCLDYWVKNHPTKDVKIFEVGFGTGLNVWLTALYAERYRVKINFHTVEPFPVPAEIYSQLNYGITPQEQDLLQQLHDAPWEMKHLVTDFFSLTKYESTLEDFSNENEFDCIYFDAFAPSKQAEVWSLENLQKSFDLCASQGVLSTYCAQGQFKRNLRAAGFEVTTLQGAMGKKEMVRGVKI